MIWLSMAMAGSLQADPVVQGQQALARREAIQTTWDQALGRVGPKAGALMSPAMFEVAAARHKARWENASTRLDLIAVQAACARLPKPGCLGVSASIGTLDGQLATLEARTTAMFGTNAPPEPPATPLGPPVTSRVLAAHTAFCEPDFLQQNGIAVIDPAKPPEFLTTKGTSSADIEKAVDQVRQLVIGWVEASERAGDLSLAQEPICVGLFDDAQGANSQAVSGIWLLIGIRDLHTMATVHGSAGLGAVDFSIGHELGHILQQKAGVSFTGPTAREGELHADCMAGYLMGVSVPTGTTSPAQAYARNEVHRIGDTNTTSPQHHGTPEERQRSFDRGWAAGTIAQSGSRNLHQTTTMLHACGLFTQ